MFSFMEIYQLKILLSTWTLTLRRMCSFLYLAFLFTLYRIIDLGFAEMIPLQFAACFPNFLTHDFQSLHDQAEVEHGNTHGPLVWRPKNTPMMRRDRAFYLQCVKELSEGDPMLEEYYRLLADKDEIRRYWWLMAATKLKVHRAMAACNWLRP